MDRERNEDSFRGTLRILFDVPEYPSKKKPKVKTVIETDEDSSWACGDIEDDLQGILKLEGETGLLKGREKEYKATEAEAAYLRKRKE